MLRFTVSTILHFLLGHYLRPFSPLLGNQPVGKNEELYRHKHLIGSRFATNLYGEI